MTYYKATKPDGTSFYDGGTKWEVGKTTKIPKAKRGVGICQAGVLHASDAVGEVLTGGYWPCRLFIVEGEAVSQQGHKYSFHALKVVEEIEAWRALGPNGQEVAALIERFKTLNAANIRDLAAARPVAWDVAWAVAWDAAWDVAWAAAWDVAWAAAWDVAGHAARSAALALVVKDLITKDQFDILVGPWVSVMGRTWE